MLFGEGGRDRKFYEKLTDHRIFQYHTKKWNFHFDNAWGCSPKEVVEQCIITKQNVDYDLVICFIDLDVLKREGKKWEVYKIELEKHASDNGIYIYWHIDNAENEYIRVLGQRYKKYNKHQLNEYARKNIYKFVNQDLWNNLKEIIKKRENILGKVNRPRLSS